jgi:hypothetical protein
VGSYKAKEMIMNWNSAYNAIKNSITKGLEINTRNSKHRIVLEIPPYKCATNSYGNSEGFKVRIGVANTIEIPISMLESLYEASIINNSTYENKVFEKLYPKQLKQHGCQVHVVGQIFVKSGLAKLDGTRMYKLI